MRKLLACGPRRQCPSGPEAPDDFHGPLIERRWAAERKDALAKALVLPERAGIQVSRLAVLDKRVGRVLDREIVMPFSLGVTPVFEFSLENFGPLEIPCLK